MNNSVKFNSFLLEANSKINELILETYKAGINYGFATAQLFQQAEQEMLQESKADGKSIDDLIGEWHDTKSSDN